MAKKVPKQENPPTAAQDHLSEQMASLKALNNLLVRETVERREKIDMLQRSNQSLESEIARSAANSYRLEAEKSLCEERMLAADLKGEIDVLVVSLQQKEVNSEMTQKLKSMEKEREELIARIADMAEHEIKLREMQEDVDRLVCEMGRIRKDLHVKKEAADGLRSTVKELQMSNEEAREEMGLLQMESDRIRKEKMEVEGRFESVQDDRDSIQRTLHELMERYEDLKRQMRDAVKERDEIERARNEMGVEMSGLQKEVSLLTAELCSNKDSLGRILLERDAIRNDLDLQKEEGKRTLESLMTERASSTRRLMESSQLIEDLKTKMEQMVRDKDKMERTSAEKEVAITELQNEVVQLGVTISTLRESCGYLTETNHQLLDDLSHRKDLLDRVSGERDADRENINRLKEEENGLRAEVFELEKNNVEVREELKRVAEELDGLMEERKESKRSLKSLMEEKMELLQRGDDVMRKMKEIVEEKDKIEQVRIEQEDHITQLQKEVSWLSTTVSALQESCREHEERNDRLQTDISHILCEKDVVCTDLDHQRQEAEGLRSKIRDMEKSHEEKLQELLQLKTENHNLVEETKEMERRFELLKKAKDSIEGNLVESQRGLKHLQIKTEVAEMVSRRALSMLKHATKTMNVLEDEEEKGSKGKDGIESEEMNDEIQPFSAELEAIKDTYRSRLREVEDMDRELKSLKMSIAKSKKQRSIWAWLSSASTIFAAVYVAYVAKGR